MKKFLSLLLAAVMAFSFAACRQTNAEEDAASLRTENDADASAAEVSPEEPTAAADGNILIAYFSWAENAIQPAAGSEVDAITSPSVTQPGNVQQLAGWVQEETGGDLFSIRVTEPYPSDWDACLERAHAERSDDARPALQENVSGLAQYDTVFLGYPNWWYGVPMALISFLEQNDLSGKNVYLFCSHGTGGLANSVEQIQEAAPDARISDSIFDCYEEDAASSEDAIREWVRGLGFAGSAQADNGSSPAPQQRVAVRFIDRAAVYAHNACIERMKTTA